MTAERTFPSKDEVEASPLVISGPSVTGKGGRTRQVLLPQIVSVSLLALRGDVGADDPVFASHKGARRLTERTVGYMLKRAAKYLHARPNTSSGLKLDEGIFR